MDELYTWYIAQHHGAHTYVELERRAIRLAKYDRASASLFVLIAGLARYIHRQVEGVPLDVNAARDLHDVVAKLLSQSKEAIEQKRNILENLNDLAIAQLEISAENFIQ